MQPGSLRRKGRTEKEFVAPGLCAGNFFFCFSVACKDLQLLGLDYQQLLVGFHFFFNI